MTRCRISVSKRRAKACSGSVTSLRPPPNKRLQLTAACLGGVQRSGRRPPVWWLTRGRPPVDTWLQHGRPQLSRDPLDGQKRTPLCVAAFAGSTIRSRRWNRPLGDRTHTCRSRPITASANAKANKDLCRIDDPAGGPARHFVRAVLPVSVEHRQVPIRWGLWAEVSEEAFRRILELWSQTPSKHLSLRLRPPSPTTFRRIPKRWVSPVGSISPDPPLALRLRFPNISSIRSHPNIARG